MPKPKAKAIEKKRAVTKVAPPIASPSPAPVAPKAAPVQAAPVAQPVHTRPVVKASACAKPAYPRASLRANEEGIVKLKLLVGSDGRVIESHIERSSGFTRLDEAAREALSLCAFQPATLDGKPVQDWALLQYEWKIDSGRGR
jgi:protein TonB